MTATVRCPRITILHLSYGTGTYTHGGPLREHDTEATHGAHDVCAHVHKQRNATARTRYTAKQKNETRNYDTCPGRSRLSGGPQPNSAATRLSTKTVTLTIPLRYEPPPHVTHLNERSPQHPVLRRRNEHENKRTKRARSRRKYEDLRTRQTRKDE